MNKKERMRIARKVLSAIMADLLDRRGLRQTIESIDDEIRREMNEKLRNIIEGVLAKELP